MPGLDEHYPNFSLAESRNHPSHPSNPSSVLADVLNTGMSGWIGLTPAAASPTSTKIARHTAIGDWAGGLSGQSSARA